MTMPTERLIKMEKRSVIRKTAARKRKTVTMQTEIFTEIDKKGQ